MDLDTQKTMAIIGAGPVGLALAKALKQAQIPYVQFDADADVGGNWRHGVYTTAHIISSRKTTEFPDFPMPDDYPDFPSGAQMLAYLEAFADHYDLRPAIRFNTRVSYVRPAANDLWEVSTSDGRVALYKGVLICNGHHWDKRMPHYPGNFAGAMMHSKDYKNPEQLRDKRVLVIGGGNSACDVASEAARVGKAAHISQRRGYWLLPKTVLGMPTAELAKPWLPVWIQRLMLRVLLRLIVGKYTDYGLQQPDHKIFERHPTINSELLHYLKHGKINPHPDIERWEGNRVTFVDGQSIEVDTVVCATGYHVSHPMLPEGLVPVKNAVPQIYGNSFPDGYRHLYIVGWSQPRYGFGPLAGPGMALLARMIKMQDEMELPLGTVLKNLGDKIPTTHLVDPHAAMKRMRKANKRLWMLKKMEKRMRAKVKIEPNREWPSPTPERLETTKVY